MASANYTTDLQIYNDCTSASGWAEATNMESGNGSGEVDGDLAIYGSGCYTEAQRKTGLSSLVFTGTAPSWTSGWCYFIWSKMFAPNSLATKSSGGIRMLLGSSSSNYYGHYIGGSGTYEYGGWLNYVVDPEFTPRDQTQGSPSGTWNTVGMGWNLPTTAPQKGNSLNIDILRYGRGESIFTDGDLGNGYATFLGFSLLNDNPTTGRWGLLQNVGGGYLYKGLMSLGTTSTSVDFRDSNTQVTVDNTEKVISTFNRIEINNASSRVDWSSISFVSLGTVSKGELEVIDNADVNIESCSFTDMNTFIFQSNSTINNSTFRRDSLITQGSSVFDGCVFSNSTNAVSLLVNNLTNISNCDFESDGSNHAIELTSAHAGNTYNLDNINWLDYAVSDGSTGNEALYNNSGGAVTLSVVNGGTTPSVRNGTSASTTFVSSVTLTFNVNDSAGDPIEDATAYIDDDNSPTYIMNELTTSLGVATENWVGGSVVGATWRVRKYGYKPYFAIIDIPASGTKDIPVTLVTDLQQT